MHLLVFILLAGSLRVLPQRTKPLLISDLIYICRIIMNHAADEFFLNGYKYVGEEICGFDDSFKILK